MQDLGCGQPLLHVTHDALVPHPVLDKFHQPYVVNRIEGFDNLLPLSTTHSMTPWKS
jgi:hypothetical protein